jgi:hypothetical protein
MTFNFNENKISFEDNVKLLRVTIDSNSNFNNHISEINKKKASMHLHCIGKYSIRNRQILMYAWKIGSLLRVLIHSLKF